MKKLLAVLAVVAMAAPAFAQVGYFQATGDGQFGLYRSSSGPEYGDGGGTSTPRLSKDNQDMGWMSFYGATGDAGGSIADFVNNNAGGDWSKVQATLYFRMTATVPTTGSALAIESLRSGNVGGLVEDGGSVGSMTTVPAGYAGSSQNVAFRACAPTAPTASPKGFVNIGDGIYQFNDPTNPNPGTPWISPAGRTAGTGRNGFLFGAHQAIQYDLNGDGTNASTLTGLYKGYNADGAQGANFWALEDLLGIRQNNGTAGSVQQVYDAGQILVGGKTTPTLFVPGSAATTDARKGTTDPNWHSVVLDQAFIQDQATNPEAKGLVFTSKITGSGAVSDWNNIAFYSKEASGGAWAPYIQLTVVPEPATLCLLALGGLALLRRRQA